MRSQGVQQGPSSIDNARTLLVSVLVAVPVFYVLLSYVLQSDSTGAVWLPVVAWAVVSAIVAARSLVAARNATIVNERRAWVCMATAAAIWCLGIVYEAAASIWVQGFAFGGGTARFFYMAYPAFFIAGVYFLTSSGPRSLRVVHLANLGVIFCSMLICALLVLMKPVIQSDETQSYIVYTVVDLTLLLTATIIALLHLWSAQSTRLQSVVILLALSSTIHAAVNVAFYYRVYESGSSGTNLDVVWLIALLLQYWAAFESDHAQEKAHDANSGKGFLTRFAIASQSVLPATLIFGTLAMMTVFFTHLTATFMATALPVAVLFTLFLGLREWALENHRKHLAKNLHYSHNLNAQVLRASPGIIFICEASPGFRMTYISDNARSLFGFDLATFDLQKHIPREDRAAIAKGLRQVLTRGAYSTECRILDASGEWRWIDQRLVLNLDANGNPSEIVGTALDITERKMLRHSVEQNQRLESLGRLSGSIAHDFNNLLTTVLGFAGIVLASERLPSEERGYVAEIQAAGERGAALTRQLLSFSRRHAFEVEIIDLNDLLDEMRGMLERLMGDSVKLVFRSSPLPVRVKANKNQLEQVLMNLALNAREAMPEGGTIQIGISEVFLDDADATLESDAESDRTAIISVQDEGMGMSEEVHAQIFDPFFTTKSEGSGLGLATVHSIVSQHRGHIEVSSQSGGGTRFDVYLPSTLEVDTSKKKVPATLPSHGTERLLVVDDEPSITRVVSGILKPLGYTVFTANNARDALRIARAEPLDLLLSDIIMPDCNGRELSRQLREIRPDIEVIFMSGYTNEVLTRRLVWDARTPLVQKPLVLSHLATAIRHRLDAAQVDQREQKSEPQNTRGAVET